jgi:hypothetical protein
MVYYVMYQVQRKLASQSTCEKTSEKLHMSGLRTPDENTEDEGKEHINQTQSNSWLPLITGFSYLALIIGIGFLEGSCPLVGIPIMLLALVWLGHVAYHSNKGV